MLQADLVWCNHSAESQIGSVDIYEVGRVYLERACGYRQCESTAVRPGPAHPGLDAAACFCELPDAIGKGAQQSLDAARVWRFAKSVLGKASVGARVLFRQFGQCHRRVHRAYIEAQSEDIPLGDGEGFSVAEN